MKNHTISFSNVLGGNAHRPRMIWSFIGAFLTAAILLTVFLVGCGNWDEGSIIGPTDALLPTVSATEPMNHATNVPINKKIALTFSEEMDPLTITKTTFTLKQGTTLVQITVNYVGLVATMTPSADLAANTTYTATISTEAEDLAGNELANEYKWIFTTGSSSDNTPPTLSSVEPATNATNVPINKKIAATFSEAMDPSTITKTTVTLKRGTKPVSGTVSYVGLVMTFTPADKFATNTEYTVTISTGVMDLAGNAMSNNFVWSFITGTTLD
ncbi:MAG: Ig-like domain-containing protein, partial [Candidatus Marinimicrobia bacterium]|nr:Ig-like domain-containing protein [Candidatus Neomarinimicrobiota bacterium]